MQRGAEAAEIELLLGITILLALLFLLGARCDWGGHCWGHRGRAQYAAMRDARRAIHRFMRRRKRRGVSVTDDPGGELRIDPYRYVAQDVAVYVGGQTLAPVRISHSAQVLSPAWTSTRRRRGAMRRGSGTGNRFCG